MPTTGTYKNSVMSLKGLQLPPEALIGLYRQPLLPQAYRDAPATAPVAAVAESAAKNYMGDNAGKITILVQAVDAPYLNDQLFAFLAGILNACKLSMKDVALFNLHRTPGDYRTIIGQTQPAVLLMLGVAPADISLPMQFPQFSIYRHDNISYLYAPSLEELQDDKALKAALWKCLKTLFEL